MDIMHQTHFVKEMCGLIGYNPLTVKISEKDLRMMNEVIKKTYLIGLKRQNIIHISQIPYLYKTLLPLVFAEARRLNAEQK